MQQSEMEKMKKLDDCHWWYVARRELLQQLVGKPRSLFEVGAGTGKNLKMFASFGIEVEGLEPDKKIVAKKKKDFVIHNSTLENFDFKKKYSTILLADVLEHIQNDEMALEKMRQALKKNGSLVITVPAIKVMYSKHDELCSHHRRYEKKELEEKLKKSGYNITFISYWNFFLFGPIFLSRIMKKIWHSDESDLSPTPEPINEILKRILEIENTLIKKRIPLPIGVSLICIATPKINE